MSCRLRYRLNPATAPSLGKRLVPRLFGRKLAERYTVAKSAAFRMRRSGEEAFLCSVAAAVTPGRLTPEKTVISFSVCRELFEIPARRVVRPFKLSP